jgi:hypothetical protein
MAIELPDDLARTRLEPDGLVLRLALIAAVGTAVSLTLMFCGAARARIDDFSNGHIRLVSVDGREPRRARGGTVTASNEALVEAGRHEFRIRLEPTFGGMVEETVGVTARVESGKSYRFETQPGRLSLVEASAHK